MCARGSFWAFSGKESLTKNGGLKRLNKGIQNNSPMMVPRTVAKDVLREIGLVYHSLNRD